MLMMSLRGRSWIGFNQARWAFAPLGAKYLCYREPNGCSFARGHANRMSSRESFSGNVAAITLPSGAFVLSLEQTENYERTRVPEGTRDKWHDRSKGVEEATAKGVGKWMPEELMKLAERKVQERKR